MIKKYSKIAVFDFDGTLCFTPEPHTGKEIFKNNTGLNWPYPGWWGRKETLDLDIFHIPVNPYVYKFYLEHTSDENCYVILATGRLEKMRKEVEKVLNSHNLAFDEVHLNPGMDTYIFKKKLFESLIKKIKPYDGIIMYDDRHEHLVRFNEWAKEQLLPVEVVDIVNKKTKKYN